MISRVSGKLVVRDLDRVEVATPGGITYEIAIPRTAFEKLPAVGKDVELRTHYVVREDGAFLYGFLTDAEKLTFTRLLSASGVGPRLALGLLSALSPARLIRAIRERDLATLTGVSGVGKKTAERLMVDLATKLDDIPVTVDARPTGAGVDEAMRGLTILGYASVDAERAVRAALREFGDGEAAELIRVALANMR